MEVHVLNVEAYQSLMNFDKIDQSFGLKITAAAKSFHLEFSNAVYNLLIGKIICTFVIILKVGLQLDSSRDFSRGRCISHSRRTQPIYK